jgi:hypothetical protein
LTGPPPKIFLKLRNKLENRKCEFIKPGKKLIKRWSLIKTIRKKTYKKLELNLRKVRKKTYKIRGRRLKKHGSAK